MKLKLKLALAILLAGLMLAYPALGSGIYIRDWDWKYDSGVVFVTGTMANTSGLSLPIILYVMDGQKTIHEYRMNVSYAEKTEFSFMFRRETKPENLKLEWGAQR